MNHILHCLMEKKIVTTYNTIYRLLPNFPQSVIDFAHEQYKLFLGGDSNLPNAKNQVDTIQPTLTMIPQRIDVGLAELEPIIIWLITPPKSAMGIIHTDKSRSSGINIPIKVNPEKGPYVAGKFNSFDSYPNPKRFELNGKFGYTWDYTEDLFEDVPITHPIFVNTGLPHSWKNEDDDYRVLASLYFKELDVDTTADIAKQWA